MSERTIKIWNGIEWKLSVRQMVSHMRKLILMHSAKHLQVTMEVENNG